MPKPPISKTFCPAPFNSVTVTATGRLSLCCDSTTDYSFNGGYKNIADKGSIAEWFDGEYMQSVREAMVEGRALKECATCYRTEKLYNRSFRLTKLKEYPEPREPDVRTAVIMFGNKCNLRCKMCFPHSSSELMKEWKSLGWDKNDPMKGQRGDYYEGYLEENYEWPRQQENVDKLMAMSGGFREMQFTGGEPMLNPQMFKFLENCVEKGTARETQLHVTTNCTSIHPRFLSLAREFKGVNLRLSVDGFGDTYDYIRYPARWPEVEANIKRYAEWFGQGKVNGQLIANVVAGVFNLHQLADLCRLLREHVQVIHITELTRPDFMTWQHAPESTQKEAKHGAAKLALDPDPLLSHTGREIATMMLKGAGAQPHGGSHRRLAEFVRAQDGHRRIKIGDYIDHLSYINFPAF